jgi:HK97 family phage major capsid protein
MKIYSSDIIETKEALSPEAMEIIKQVRSDVKSQYDAVQKKNEELASALDEVKKTGASTVDLGNTIKGLDDELKKQAATSDAMDKKLAELQLTLKAGSTCDQKSVGEMVAESDEFKSLQKQRDGRARIGLKAIQNLASPAVRSPLNSVQTIMDIRREPDRPLMVRDLIPVGRTNNLTIEFQQEDVWTNAAAPVAEGALKPESNITFKASKADVITIAHWIQASKQVLDDVAMLSSYIDGRLRIGLAQKEEDQLMNGSGVAPNMTGLVPQATAYVANPTVAGATPTMVDTLRVAKLQARQSFYAADAIVLNPQDWAKLELMKDSQSQYLFSAFASGAVPRLWGMRVVESDSLAVGKFMVGAFNLAAQIWDREDANVTVSTEDRDNFVKNMVTILAEERLGLTVFRPKSFIYGTL